MPELPEVELVARTLDKLISAKTIRVARLFEPRLAPGESAKSFARKIEGAKIKGVSRRGKHLLFELDSRATLITHLRMTGSFSFYKRESASAIHTRATFLFEDGTQLQFQDQRKFGLMKIFATQNLFDEKELRDLAPEPFSAEFNADYLRRVLSRSRRSIKEFLLDQSKVSGLGNIYASEALFLARIHPRKIACEISKPKSERLLEGVRKVLGNAIEKSSRKKVDPKNIVGSYSDGANDGCWYVYDREGDTCANCAAKIRRIVQGSRSSFFCPKCQRA